jgi:hypothetical protein
MATLRGVSACDSRDVLRYRRWYFRPVTTKQRAETNPKHGGADLGNRASRTPARKVSAPDEVERAGKDPP